MGNAKQPLVQSGVYAALATPMRAHSVEADAAALLEYLDEIVRAGVDGLVLFGSTGEFIHFDIAERMRVLTLAVRRSRVPVLVNVSHSSLAGAIDLAEQAIGVEAAGLLLMPPYFYRYADPQILHFCEQFAESVDGKLPIFLYNAPLGENRISAHLAETLLQSGVFSGIKDSSGDWAFFEALNSLRRKVPFTIFTGSETLYLRTRVAGADGVISGMAAAVPELLVAIDRAVRASDQERAQRLDGLLQEFFHKARQFPGNASIKQTAVIRGWKLNHFAVPPDDDTAADLIVFLDWVRGWLPGVLSECTEGTARK